MNATMRLRSTNKPPSALTEAERSDWANLLSQTPHLRRAFFSHGFALACEEATGRAQVTLIRDGSDHLVAVLPFQFADQPSRCARVGERMGGGLADHCGLIAEPGLRIETPKLLALAGLGALFLDHLSDGQDQFGLVSDDVRPGHVIELPNGSAAYFAALGETNKGFLQDTERRMRRLAKEFGTPEFTVTVGPDWDAVQPLIDAKRAQYARTGAGDSLADSRHLRLVRALVDGRYKDCMPVLTQLAADGRILARHLGLLHDGHLSYWFPVYDRDAQKVSPGRMLLWHTLLAADAHGIRLIDRGEGDNQAKRDFSTGVRQFGRLNLRATGLQGLVARGWQSFDWRFRR